MQQVRDAMAGILDNTTLAEMLAMPEAESLVA